MPLNQKIPAIIHLNVTGFAAAVASNLDARLKNRPVIISPQGSARSLVYDMSQEAFCSGVRKGMSLDQAKRLCKDAFVLPPRYDQYEKAMRDLFRLVMPWSPMIEGGACDGHIFMDMTGSQRLFGSPVDVAFGLRKQIRQNLGLNPVWSAAPNKLTAKTATRLVKPSGEYVVTPGDEQAFLAPLPLHLIPGIEPNDLKRFAEFNFTRVSQLTPLTQPQLSVLLGKRAEFIYDLIRAKDMSTVRRAGQTPPVIKMEHTFAEDTNKTAQIENTVYRLVEKSGRALRNQCLAAGRLIMVIDYSDGIRASRRIKIDPASGNDMTLFEFALRLLGYTWLRRVRLRHIRLICGDLVYPPAQQMSLFSSSPPSSDTRSRVIQVIDAVRSRFGDNALRFGRTLTCPL